MELDAIPAAGYDRIELLQVADAVAREKSIEREEVIEAMEQAIQKAARSKYGQEHDVRAVIDRKSGDIRLARYLEVVEEIEDDLTQITPDEARKKLFGEKAARTLLRHCAEKRYNTTQVRGSSRAVPGLP